MSVKLSKRNSFPIFLLKGMYYYAKMLGIVCFSITDSARLKTSIKLQLYSISCRLLCLIGYILLLPEVIKDVQNIKQIHIRAMIIIQFISLSIFAVVFITFQVINHKQFVSVVNRAIDIFARLLELTGDYKIFGCEFYVLLFGRVVFNLGALLYNIERYAVVSPEKRFVFLTQYFLGFILWFGALIVSDFLCLGYITASGMYQNMGNHMISLAKRVGKTEGRWMSKFRRMQAVCDFSDELENCSAIYSEIYKTIYEFHKLFQFNILFTFFLNLVTIICNIHQNFLTYIATGRIHWVMVAFGITRIADFLFMMLIIDWTVRRSKIPWNLNWDSLCSDIDSRWDRSVDYFLNQLKFEDLKIDVFGLFQVNNELCVRFFSISVAYLTILIQFSLLGYFKDDLKKLQGL